jgi:hypothetical protein
VWESSYSTHSRNPIWFSDRYGDSIDNTYEINNGIPKKIDDKGGNTTDHIIVKTPETKAPGGAILPATTQEYDVTVETTYSDGIGYFRGPGERTIGRPYSGRAEFVDDPITPGIPGLAYGVGKRVAVSISSKMYGTPQTTGTFGHAFFSRAIGLKYALNPKVEKVTFNLGYKKLWGGGNFKWGPRPDVGVLFRDGRTIAVEVMSKTDIEMNLINRNVNFGLKVGRKIEAKTFKIPFVNYINE